ncbi:MAG: type II toxin-antitoxin system RelE/ParE family toxin [Planctomycetaceae bacterium]|nr:type II toxin-antitoxin system RelE/ParE family toxin [Planctomycetaceae bacterium]
MRYRLVFAPRADKGLRRLPVQVQRTIRDAVLALADNPRPHGSIKMKGSPKEMPRYRIRVGSYRIIYRIHDDIVTVEVTEVGPRKDIYR